MILNDSEIVAQADMIVPQDDSLVKNCAYTLRAGKAFEPETGKEIPLGRPSTKLGGLLYDLDRRRDRFWVIGPSETLVVRTRERIRMPTNLCAFYAPLQRRASEGVMLLNASIVEPGYDGPLSCFLLNFSSQPVTIAPGSEIAKMTFHSLNAPKDPKPLHIPDDDYDSGLSRQAMRYHRSFLDVSGIAQRASELAGRKAQTAIVLGGLFIAMLLLFSSLEPLLSKWLHERTGLVSRTHQDLERELSDKLDEATRALAKDSEVSAMRDEIRSLAIALEALEGKVGK